MKFLCPNCKAKYQISDEKIAGRTLKMDCRRCEHAIVIRGDKAQAQGGQEGQRPSPSRPSSPGHASPNRRRSGSHVGASPGSRSSRSALGADFRRNAGAAASPSQPSALDQWHVAINDVPVGPMRRDEIGNKIQSGAITGESLCWREGLDDWRPVRDVPELAALLRRAAPPKAPAKPAFPSPPRALGRVPAPPRPGRPPTGRTANAAPRPQEPSRPAARGNVVPIGGRLGASAAPALDELDSFADLPDDDEPTRVGASVDFEQLAQERETARQGATPAPTGRVADEDAFDPFASQRASAPVPPAGAFGPGPAQPPPESSPGAFAPPPDAPAPDAPAPDAPAADAPSAAFAPPGTASSPGPSSPGTASSPGAVGFDPSVGSAPGAAAPSPVTTAASQAEVAPSRRKSLPVGAWIAIAGAMAFGVALAVMVGTHLLTQPGQPLATDPPPTGEGVTETPREATPDLDLGEETPPDEAPEEAAAAEGETEGEGEAEAETPRRAAGGGATRPTPSSGAAEQPATAPTKQVDPETAARLARFRDDSAAGAQLDIAGRNDPLAEDRRAGGGSTSLTGEQISAVVRRERSSVERCWQTALRQIGRAAGTRIDVMVTIGSSGTVMRANARGQGIGNLTECIESNVRRWRFPRSGGETRTSIPFVFQGTE